MELEDIEEMIIANDNRIKIIYIDTNQYYFYDSSQKSQQIIGIFTDGIYTCSSIVISFNEDNYLFFSHIHEKSDLVKALKNIILNKLSKKKITNIFITYTRGIGSCLNDLINYDLLIEDVIELLKRYFNDGNLKLTKNVKTHRNTISCLKIIKNNQQNDYFESIKNKAQKLFFGKKDDRFNKYINSQLNYFNVLFDKENNISYYFDFNKLSNILNSLKIILENKN